MSNVPATQAIELKHARSFTRRTAACEPSAADLQVLRKFQRQGWQGAAHVYHDFWGNLTQQLVEPMLDALALAPGCSLLDVACGPGYVAVAAAKRGAHAMGVDFSRGMLAIAERLHPDVEFREGDAESLPLDANGFSAVAMNYGIHHLSRPMLALNEIRRVLRPGGRIAFSIWASPDATKGASVVYAAMNKYGTLNAQLPPAPPLWRLDTPDAACGVLRASGFVDMLAVQVAQTWHLASADDFFRAFYDASVRTKALLRAQSAQALAMIRREIELSLRPYKRAGRIEIPMAAVLTSARKPETDRRCSRD